MIRAQALTKLRELIRIGHQQRDLFVQVCVEQDDWFGALDNPSSRDQAARLEAAQTILNLFMTDPSMEVPKAVGIISKWLVGEKTNTDLERARHRAMFDIMNLLDVNIPLRDH